MAVSRVRAPLTQAPEELTPAQQQRIKTWALEQWPGNPGVLRRRLRGLWEECRDWHLSRGVLRADWEATMRNWVRKDAEFSRSDRRGRRFE